MAIFLTYVFMVVQNQATITKSYTVMLSREVRCLLRIARINILCGGNYNQASWIQLHVDNLL